MQSQECKQLSILIHLKQRAEGHRKDGSMKHRHVPQSHVQVAQGQHTQVTT